MVGINGYKENSLYRQVLSYKRLPLKSNLYLTNIGVVYYDEKIKKFKPRGSNEVLWWVEEASIDIPTIFRAEEYYDHTSLDKNRKADFIAGFVYLLNKIDHVRLDDFKYD